MTEQDALAELRAAGIPASLAITTPLRIYLNDGTNCSITVRRFEAVDDAAVWHAIWCWVTGHVMGTDRPNLKQCTCKQCGDGTRPGYELCDGCHRKKLRASWVKAPRTDNWRASARYPRSRYR